MPGYSGNQPTALKTTMTQLSAAKAQAAQARADRKAAAAERRNPVIQAENNRINQIFVSEDKNKVSVRNPIENKVQYKFVERKGQLVAELSKLQGDEIPVFTILHQEWTNALQKLQPTLDLRDVITIKPIYLFLDNLVVTNSQNLRNASINWVEYAEIMNREFGEHYDGTFREVQTGLNPVMNAEQAKAFREVVSPQILQFCRQYYRSVD